MPLRLLLVLIEGEGVPSEVRYRLTFRALPAETAPEIRIRHLLKKARYLGLVAMLAEEIPAPPAEPSEENTRHADPT